MAACSPGPVGCCWMAAGGMYVYVTYYNGVHDISAFRIDASSGALTPIAHPSFQPTLGAASVAIAVLR